MYSAFLFAQEKDNPNVELPDFVITGKEAFIMPKAEKEIPPLISTVSDTYLKPVFPAEDLEVREFSDPLKATPAIKHVIPSEPASIKLRMGSLFLPSAELFYKSQFWGLDFTSFTDAKNRRAFEENGDAFFINQKIKLERIIPQDAEFLSGAKFFINSDFVFNKYKMFATNPVLKRNWYDADFEIGLKNLSSNSFSYSLSFKPKLFNLESDFFNLLETSPRNIVKKELETTELKTSGLMIISLGKLKFNLLGDFATHKYEFGNSIINNNFFSGNGSFEIPFSKVFSLSFGLNYAKFDTSSFTGMKGNLSLLLDKGLSLSLGLNSNAHLITPSMFVTKNHYLYLPSAAYLLMDENNKISMSLRYEFDKYFEIQIGGENFKSENSPYFVPTGDERFTISRDTVTHSSAFLKMYFHKGPLGSLYLSGKYQDAKANSGNTLPYVSKISVDVVHSNKIMDDWRGSIFFHYNSGYFLDITNQKEESGEFDIGLEVEYLSGKNFSYVLDVKNILNQKRFEYQNYVKPGLNISFGLNYTW